MKRKTKRGNSKNVNNSLRRIQRKFEASEKSQSNNNILKMVQEKFGITEEGNKSAKKGSYNASKAKSERRKNKEKNKKRFLGGWFNQILGN